MNPIREALESVADRLESGGTNEAVAAPVEGGTSGDGGAIAGGAGDPGLASRVEADAGTPGESAAEAAQRARDDKGRFAPGSKEAKASATPAPVAAKPTTTVKPVLTPVEGSGTPPPAVATVTETVKAPQSWKPLAREKWASLPAEVQAEVLRLDKEMRGYMQTSAPERKFAEEVRSVLGPHEARIRADGREPMAAVAEMLQVEQALRDPRRAPSVIAHLVKGLNVPIEALAAALDGQPAQQQAQGQEYRDPRVDQLLGQIHTAKQQKEQAKFAKAQANLEAFIPTAEFFKDVAPLMEMVYAHAAANKLPEPSLEDVYDQACWSHPEVRATLKSRERENAAKAGMVSTQASRAAASSLKSQPTGSSSTTAKPGSIRASLEAAADAVSKR